MERLPFTYKRHHREYERSFMQGVSRIVERQTRIPERNKHTFQHGRTWQSISSDAPDEVGTLELHSTEAVCEWSDVVDGKLESLPKFINDITTKMTAQMTAMMLRTVSDASDRVGNTVNAREFTSTLESMMEMYQRIEFGVDENGQVTEPEMLTTSPELIMKIKAEIDVADRALLQQIEDIKKQKTAEALEREKNRRKRFRYLGAE